MTTELTFKRELIGKPIELDTVVFDAHMIDSYLAAVGEKDLPADDQGPYAPPLMGIAFVGGVPDIQLEWGSKGFMAGQVFYPLAPIRVGDEITTTSVLRDVYPKTGRSGHMVFIVWDAELRNQHGALVARCRRSFVKQE